MKTVNRLLGLIFIASIALLTGGYFGAKHPVVDLLSAFRLYAILALAAYLLSFLFSRRFVLAGLSVLLLGFGLFGIWPQLRQPARGPVLVGGGFNAVPWATPEARIVVATRTQVISGLRFSKTMLGGILQLPIDHALVPEGWQAATESGPRPGSDHRPILAYITPL